MQTLLNELSLPKFSKFNCVALLNTLYPLEEEDVNADLTAIVLSQHRKSYWKYIISVEKNGPEILDAVKFINGGWEHISDVIERYCSESLELIQKAEDLSRPTSIGSFRSDSSIDMMERTTPRKPSFGRRNSNDSSEAESEGSVKLSTLEKIVRGLAKLGGSSSSKKTYSSEWSSDVKMRNYD